MTHTSANCGERSETEQVCDYDGGTYLTFNGHFYYAIKPVFKQFIGFFYFFKWICMCNEWFCVNFTICDSNDCIRTGTARGTLPCLICKSLEQMLASVTLTTASPGSMSSGLGFSTNPNVPSERYICFHNNTFLRHRAFVILIVIIFQEALLV